MRDWSGSTKRLVLLELEVDPSEALLHDYDAWHFCLNYWYVARARRSSAFERRCEAEGLSPYRHKPLPNTELHAELVATWQTIFDLREARRTLEVKPHDQQVQATFWEIRPEQVLSAREFGAKQPAVWLPPLARDGSA